MNRPIEHLFSPIVWVGDDGKITIDWSGSYMMSIYPDSGEQVERRGGDPDGSAVLDRWVDEHPEARGVVQEGQA